MNPIRDAIDGALNAGHGAMSEALNAWDRLTHEQRAELEAQYREQHDRDARQREQERAAAESERRQQRRGAVLKSWGVPAKDIERILADEITRTDALDWARRFLDQLGPPGEPSAGRRCLLVLGGPCGCGKTTAASWWLAQGLERWGQGELDGMFVRAARLVRWPRFDDKAMAQLETASALVLDDLGAEYLDDKGAFRAFVDGVVDARYADRRPTLITTNLDGAGFVARYGARFQDRMREAGRFVELAGTSMRGAA